MKNGKNIWIYCFYERLINSLKEKGLKRKISILLRFL